MAESANTAAMAAPDETVRVDTDVDVDQVFERAIGLHREGRWAEAEPLYRSILRITPDDFRALCGLGLIRGQQGNLEEAVLILRQAASVRPLSADAQARLANILVSLDRPTEAIEHYERALALAPDHAVAHNQLANIFSALNRPEFAIVHYAKTLSIDPNQAKAHNNIGTALQAVGRFEEAASHFQQALAIQPDLAEACNNLGTLCTSRNDLEAAIGYYERALAIDPELAEAHCNLGNALLALHRPNDAVAHHETAIIVKPELARLHHDFGILLQALGRLEEADRAFERAVSLAPGRADFHLALAHSRRFTARDPRLAAMQEALDLDTLSEAEEIALHFALGKAYEDLEQYQQSFHHLRAGNALKRRRIAYNEAQTIGMFDRIRATFTPALMQEKRGCGDPCPTPVFVVGMPRSGTTLIEQILATHSKVFGAGEREELRAALPDLKGPNDTAVFPEVVSILTGRALGQFGSRYLQRIAAFAPTAERIVDKMPSNFYLIGLIRLALPGARIIHARRDPVDTCFSCFSLLFVGDQPFTYDFGELGRYYRAYEALMAHWRATLPEGVMLEVQYEDVIADLEGQARRIIAHCGLAWEDPCRDFHATQRLILTGSSRQVRQPIYRSSVGRWRPYGDMLRPLLQALNVAVSNEQALGERPPDS
jgi:tetratricopeptide (TPR) repeat protein